MKRILNHKLYFFILIIVFFSCKKQEKSIPVNNEEKVVTVTKEEEKVRTNNIIQKIEKSIPLCNNCKPNLTLGELEWLLSLFNKDLSTNDFSSLIFNDVVSFSLCNDKVNSQYVDCFSLFEFKIDNKSNIDEIFKTCNKILTTTIHYKPPQNWLWYKQNNKIYFLYSSYYSINSKEFKTIDSIINN